MSLVGGVPKSRSNVPASRDEACGRNEKIPPPPLSTTTNVQGTSGRLTNPETSWRKARSPSSAIVRASPGPGANPGPMSRPPTRSTRRRRSRSRPDSPAPGAVPLRWRQTTRDPGSAWRRTRRRWHLFAAAYRWTARATCGSLNSVPSTPAMAACAFASRVRQESSHSGSHGEAPSRAAVSQGSVADWWNSVATRWGSAHCCHGSTTMTRAPACGSIRDVLAERPGEPGRPERHDGVRQRRLRADDRIGRGDRPVHPAARSWVGHDRPSEPIRQREHASGFRGSGRLAADDDDPAAPERFRTRPRCLALRWGRPLRDPGAGAAWSGTP